ncbi:MAG: TIGR03564 family F420-dependent LLM class oxidoreductase [Acidimicrobiales bacterium]
MRTGLMIGSDREHPRSERLSTLIEDVQAAEDEGFASVWIPQVPGYLDAMTVVTALGQATERLELGTSVVPIQSRHPIALAQQALTTQLACKGRFTLGLGPSHHWLIEEQWGLSYEKPALLVRDYLEVLRAAFEGPGSVEVENESFRVHSPMNVIDPEPMSVLISALAPMMLRLAGEQTSGTILWMADEKAISEHVIPRITKAATGAGRPRPRIVAGVPVALCRRGSEEAARSTAKEVLGHADFSPNYARLLEQGDAKDIDDVMAVGDEASIASRLRGYRDAGVTDLMARIVPLGESTEERLRSRREARQYVATLISEL